MDWDDLRIFVHVARTGQIIEAARLLNLDHSTVSRRLTRLEETLGTKLFDRAGRRLKINTAGTDLLDLAIRVETIVLRDVPAKLGEQDLSQGIVRVGAPEGLGAGYLSRKLHLLGGENTGREVELVALPQNYSLASREVDIAITLDRPTAGNIATRRLTDYGLGFFAACKYVEKNGTPLALADLSSHRLCGYIPSLLHTRELDYLKPVGLKPRLRTTSIIAQREIIENGNAIGVLPFFLARDCVDLQPILASAFALKRSYWLSVHDDLRNLGRIRAVAKALVDTIRRDAAVFLEVPST